jgi:hypothetical protein
VYSQAANLRVGLAPTDLVSFTLSTPEEPKMLQPRHFSAQEQLNLSTRADGDTSSV